jgi:hypothetical protein
MSGDASTTKAAAEEDRKAPAWKTVFPMLAHLFAQHFSVKDYFNLAKVNKGYSELVKGLIAKSHHLDLRVFWSFLGQDVARTGKLEALVGSFTQLRVLSFAYCDKIDDATLALFLRAIKKPAQITSLNLYYCNQLTDASVQLLVELLPHLQRLELGRCRLLTEGAVTALSKLTDLRTLSVKYCKVFTPDAMMALEVGFTSLSSLDVTFCPKLEKEMLLQSCNVEGQKRIFVHGPQDPKAIILSSETAADKSMHG